jgi:DNA repair exonuclease SbcCD ATPase subunit
MDNSELKTLVDTFLGYRELLVPIQSNLHDFAETYESMKADIGRLNVAFEGDIKGNLEKIYLNLSKQAERATDLSSRIEQFILMTEKYSAGITRLASLVEHAGERLGAINALENKAEEQILKLDEILEEKRKNYNIKELQRTLESYNANVQRVSDYINKDIAEALSQNYNKLESIKTGHETLQKRIKEEHSDIETLLSLYSSVGETLKRTVEKEDVNEAYIFDILDRWAETRKVKTKK